MRNQIIVNKLGSGIRGSAFYSGRMSDRILGTEGGGFVLTKSAIALTADSPLPVTNILSVLREEVSF